MRRVERAIYIMLLCIFCLSTVAPPISYAAQLLPPPTTPSVNANLLDTAPTKPVPQTKFDENGSVFGASTSFLAIGTGEDSNTEGSASKWIPIRMQQLTKKVYQTDEPVTLTVDNTDNEPFTTTVLDAKNQAVGIPESETGDGTTTNVQLEPSNEITPGKYTIEVTDNHGDVTTQDFTWGVLALNTDKSMYHPGETANLSIGVLNDNGDMVCNALLTMQITNTVAGINDTLSTQKAGSRKIQVNQQCQSHDFSLQPDYQAQYQFKKPGTYSLQLTATTLSGTHSISSSIDVTNNIPFDVQRVSATRIYPPNMYPMTFTITAHRDFSGIVTETVPQNFIITPATESAIETTSKVNSYTDMQTVYLNGSDPSIGLAQTIATESAGLAMPFHGYYPITQGFGAQETDPVLQAFYTQYGLAGHDGVDFGVPMDTPLYAVDNGTVTCSGPGDYGITIIIQHTWGESYYGHLSTPEVKVGGAVTKGELIGYSGDSGEVTGPHLHFGMKPINPDMTNGYFGKIDPLPYLPFGHTALATAALGGSENVVSPETTILGASTAASITPPIVSPTVLPALSASPSATVTVSPPEQTQQPTITETPITSTPTAFSVIDKEIQTNEVLENNSQTEKVKVISWQVSLKNGETTTLGYDYQAPPQSPQFYLLGPMQFYQSGTNKVVFQEQRQWQIASDDVGIEWFNNSSGPQTWNGYSWQYRKKITINASDVSTASSSAQTPAVTFIDSGGDASQGTSDILTSSGGFYNNQSNNPTIDCTTSETGQCSYKFSPGGTSQEVALQKNAVLQDSGTRISMYIKYSSLPTSGKDAVVATFNSGSTFITDLANINSTGNLCIGASASPCGSDVLSTSTWYHLTVSYTCTSTSVNQVKIYLNDTLEISATNQTWMTNCGTAALIFGSNDSGTNNENVILNVDDIYIDKGTDLSDPGPIHVTDKLPISDASESWTTTVGTPTNDTPCIGGTGILCEYVNEQPLDTNDYIDTATNAKTQTFGIQNAVSGDENISNATYIADQAWAYMDSSATCATGNATIINNGISTNLTLPTVNTMETNTATLSAYPSTTTAIGLSSCTTGAPTIKLYEAGIQIAYTLPNIYATPAEVQAASNTSGTSLSIAKAFTSNNTAGNLIVAMVSWDNANTNSMTCSDSQGNYYTTALLSKDTTNQDDIAICYAADIKGGANTVTATFGANSNILVLAVHEYSGVATTNPLDVSNSNIANGTSGTNGYTAGSATTTTNGDLIFGTMQDDTSTTGTLTAGTNYTKRIQASNTGGYPFITEDTIQSTAGSVTTNFSENQADGYVAGMVAFKPGPAGLSNYPVLVSIPSDPSLLAHTQAGGNDIVFTDSTGENILPFEIENYTTGTLNAWVQIPALSSSTNTIIYM
jgi:murein DD-endopeptidase MepM/ murein hydrolase activator NlpD